MKVFEIALKYMDSDKIAVFEKGKSLSYRQLYQKANVLSQRIHKGKNDEKVAIYLPNGCDYIVSYYAVLLSDCTVLPINIQAKQEEMILDYQICKFSFLITDQLHFSRLPKRIINDEKINILLIEEIDFDSCNKLLKKICIENEVAVLINTSGTTSNPKIIMLSHDNILSCLDSYVNSTKYNEDMVLLIKIPYTSSFGNIVFLGALYMHATIVCGESIISQRNFLEIVDQRKVTHVECISSFLNVISQNELTHRYDISSLEYIGFGGDVVYEAMIERLMRLYQHVAISQKYGMSEASPIITVFDPDVSKNDKKKFREKITSVGTAVKNVKLRIEGDMQEGELLIKGSNVMLGYINNQAETDKVIINGWLHTGDIVYIDEDSHVYIKGRKKNIIIVGGYNVLPEEIESVLCRYKGVTSAYAYGVDDKYRGQQIECKVEVDDSFCGTELDVKKFCGEILPFYKVPHKILVVDSLKRNSTGKITRNIFM